jgi:cytohesin
MLVGCGESQQSTSAPEAKPDEPVAKASKPEPPTAKAPDISIHVLEGNIEAVKKHLASGADVNAKTKFTRTTLLHTASLLNRMEIAELLIIAGYEVNAKDADGTTPLDIAIRRYNSKMADLLRKHGGKYGSLYTAVRAKDLEGVNELLTAGANVNEKVLGGLTPLDWSRSKEIDHLLRKHGGKYSSIHYAVAAGDVEAVKQHLAAGADVNAKDEDGQTPLDRAVKFNVTTEIADLLRKHGGKTGEELKPVEPVAEAAKPEPPTAKAPDISIHDAVEEGNIEAVKQHLAAGTDVNVKGGRMVGTPLHYAALEAHKEIIELLIAKGADVNAKDKHGRISLHLAALGGHKEIAELLIAKGADVNAKGMTGWTALHQAAIYGYKEIAELLIAEGADVNAKASSGIQLHTPLDEAIKQQRTETADLLRKHGGKTGVELSIHAAARVGHIEAVKKHLAAGADVNAKGGNEWTPLHWAANEGHKEVVELLITKGADVNAKNEDGWNPLHWAAAVGQNEIAELLIAEGANVNAKDDDGDTPLDQAILDNQTAIADLLRKHGSKTGEELKAEGK